MFRKISTATMTLLAIVGPPIANAQGQDLFGEGSWYGSVRTGIVPKIGSDGQYFGPTESVYGGTPLFEMDDGSQYTFAIGRELFTDWRLELEFSYLSSHTDSASVLGNELRVDDVFGLQADVDSMIFMANLGYDFNNLNWWVTPYVRGGIGVADTDVDAVLGVEYNSAIWTGTAFEDQVLTDHAFPEGSSSEFTWSAAAGFKKKLADRFGLRLEYGYLNRGEAWTGVDENDDFIKLTDLESQQIMLGLDYRFD